jgi:DNA mismatch repair protein MutS
MLEQYRRLKAEHPGSILLFRMGDFYETFGEDALVASRVLGIALTSRDKKRDPTPLAGVPHHSLEGYLRKLVHQGYSVAIAEQMEPPEQAKGLVERQVIEVVTPGTVTRIGLLDAVESNYIAALCPGGDDGVWGLAVAEVSTGEFRIGDVAGEDLERWALSFPAREVLLPEDRGTRQTAVAPGGTGDRLGSARFGSAAVTRLPSSRFDTALGRATLEKKFDVRRLDSFGLDGVRHGLGAAGALLDYLRSLKKSDLPQIRDARPLAEGAPLVTDEVTLRNLEVFESGAGPEHTLLAILDRTETSMGARALRAMLRAPASDRSLLERRLDRTEALANSASLRAELRDRLHRLPDLERALGLLGSGRAGPRDVGVVRDALRRLPALRLSLEGRREPVLAAWAAALPDLSLLAAELEAALVEELPLGATQGGIVREGFDPELDRLRRDAGDARSLVLALEASERERTGIANLKVGFNRVFGYYIEITKSQLSRAPSDYIRKQTLTGAERFVTPELRRMEERIETSSVEAARLETAHFQRLREHATAAMEDLAAAARAIAEIDVFLSFGDTAARERWTRPRLTEDGRLRLRRARHPMVERALGLGHFVPNDLTLDTAREQVWLITGPNMGGKSTFLRQTGIAVYLAQVGSFVPCDEAEIGLVDRIFTRVGASDQIARGASTFFIEMEETATILRQASNRSLVLLDEVGRGTSTYDGLSLAWAITEAFHERRGGGPRTLFATHYHELTDLEATLPRLRNRTVRVSEEGGTIVFLHEIAEGKADRSYGIHVAQLAGVPEGVLARARQVLTRLETEHAAGSGAGAGSAAAAATAAAAAPAAAPDSTPPAPADGGVTRAERDLLIDDVANADVEAMTPLDALNTVARWRGRARGASGPR